MPRRTLWPLLLAIGFGPLLLNGCTLLFEDPPPEPNVNCDPGFSRDCRCSNGKQGAQSCSDDGRLWLACDCECEPNATRECVCPGENEGAQVCGEDGLGWGPCGCPVCVPGSKEACDCGRGFTRTRLCSGDGLQWGECECDNLPCRCEGAAPQATRQQGVCRGSVRVCDFESCEWAEPNYDELPGYDEDDSGCDGKDSDCDGSTDEDYVADGSCGVGHCQRTNTGSRCEDGVEQPCVAGTPLSEEDATCDGIDDDCDGQADEDYPVRGGQCGQGFCQAEGEERCSEGRVLLDCTPGDPLADTDSTCDGVDDDCDGRTDEEFEPRASVCYVGACAAAGSVTCLGGAEQDDCRPGEPTEERCNGVDDNCDGAVDEPFEPGGDRVFRRDEEELALGAVCLGQGQCGEGTVRCAWDGLRACCSADPGCEAEGSPGLGASAESCNGLDDDCDGVVDEDVEPGEDACAGEEGVCLEGDTLCQGEQGWQCSYPETHEDAETLCDGLDNDCDGATDEQLTPPAGTPACLAAGVCAGTEATCRGAEGWGCSYPQTYEQDETRCDGLDNDCDEETDEELTPPVETPACLALGVCAGTQPACVGAEGWGCPYPQTYEQNETLCDGLDNDCDEAVDEVEVEVVSLRVTFDPRTLVDVGHAWISVFDKYWAEIQGSPFSGDELAGQTLEVPGNMVHVRLEANPEALALFGYRVTEITDQAGNPATGPPLPESAHPYAPGTDEAPYEMANSLGAGLTCGRAVGRCRQGRTQCIGAQLLCVGDVRPEPEQCNGIDDDCNGATDDELPPEPCERQLGICEGTQKTCHGENGWLPCTPATYGDDYQLEETRCDCLDNDCDGSQDEAEDGEALACSLADMRQGPERECEVTASGSVASGTYRFGSLHIAPGVTVQAQADNGGGYQGHCGSNGGGHLTLQARTLLIEGNVRADAAATPRCGDDHGGGGGSGGDVWLLADEITISGELGASGAAAVEGRNINTWGGGGAGGSIFLLGGRIQLDGVVTAHGRGSWAGEIGAGGAGGRGGNSQGNHAGAGAGGPGGERSPGPANPDRPIRIAGDATGSGSCSTQNGAGTCNGIIDLWGEASLWPQDWCASEIRTATLAVRLLDDQGDPVAAVPVRVEEDLSGALIAEGVSDDVGWLAANPSLVPEIDYRLLMQRDDLPAGEALVSYGDIDQQLRAHATMAWSEGDEASGVFQVQRVAP